MLNETESMEACRALRGGWEGVRRGAEYDSLEFHLDPEKDLRRKEALEHSWIEPTPADHFYRVPLPDGARRIEVVATDRFGQTNVLTDVLYDAYNGTNPNTMQQAIYLFNTGHADQDTQFDSQWVCNGSYLRANLIQLGYTFDSDQLKKTPFRL